MELPKNPPEYGELRPIGTIAAEVISGLKPRRIEHYKRLGPRTCGSVLPLAEARAGP